MVVRQYDSGFTIRVTVNENAVPVDISTADPIALVFRPPGAAGDRSVTPTFATDDRVTGRFSCDSNTRRALSFGARLSP
jgi:hypothetical protein